MPPMSTNAATNDNCEKADIAVIGLAVMGQNLILNMNDNGYVVTAYNRTVSKVEDFLKGEAKGTKIIGASSLEEMVSTLKSPKRVMLMIKAGSPVDQFIDLLVPLLEQGDIIIDGGNSLYSDTERRTKDLLARKNIHFIGAGVSGGELGARYGPSIMPGGSEGAWPAVKEMFQSISAKVDPSNLPCCDWVGKGGSGHFVKMVHNGIEYGDMQLICEAYHFMRDYLGMGNVEIAETFDEWNGGVLDSFLIEITSNIIRFKREEDEGRFLLNLIRDTAGQKGTGRWTVEGALELGVPMTLVSEAVFSRALSSRKEERKKASQILPSNLLDNDSQSSSVKFSLEERKVILDNLRDALYCSKIISYTQGFMVFREASEKFDWSLNNGAISTMWKGGCIIRSAFLGDIKKAFDANPSLECLLFDSFFKNEIERSLQGWRSIVSMAIRVGIPTPAMSSAISFYDGYRTEKLPANLLQAQRDYFGAHTFELLSSPGTFHHVDWTGEGGKISSTSYNA